MKKKGNKGMPTPKQKLINNPIPTSLFLSYTFLLDEDTAGTNLYTVEPRNKGHLRTEGIILYSEVVPYWEVSQKK